jgi:hypothetical protein
MEISYLALYKLSIVQKSRSIEVFDKYNNIREESIANVSKRAFYCDIKQYCTLIYIEYD